VSVSRLDKFVREYAGKSSLAESHDLRDRDVELRVGARASGPMGRPAVAVALRCFTGRVHVVLDAAAAPHLGAEALEEARAYGKPNRLVQASAESGSRVVRVGLARPVEGGVVADASGWRASVNQVLESDEPAEVAAAAFAVACAFGKLFAGLLCANHDALKEQWSFSLMDFTSCGAGAPANDGLNIGAVTLVGAGAIGSAFAAILRLSRWTGTLRVVDDESYEEPNHETTLLISVEDACLQLPKAATLAARAARAGLITEAVAERVHSGHAVLSTPCTVLVCGVDNAETRCILDGATCELLLNAGVGGSHLDAGLIVWSRHDGGGRTLASLYSAAVGADEQSPLPPPVEVDSCSRVAYDGVTVAAPFMALASAALLAAAVAHHAIGRRPPSSYLQFNLLELQGKYAERGRTAAA
jgi:hypothetical protein